MHMICICFAKQDLPECLLDAHFHALMSDFQVGCDSIAVAMRVFEDISFAAAKIVIALCYDN